MFGIFRYFRRRVGRSSSLSEFMRHADAAERKRVYRQVLAMATEQQNRVAAAAAERARAR